MNGHTLQTVASAVESLHATTPLVAVGGGINDISVRGAFVPSVAVLQSLREHEMNKHALTNILYIYDM